MHRINNTKKIYHLFIQKCVEKTYNLFIQKRKKFETFLTFPIGNMLTQKATQQIYVDSESNPADIVLRGTTLENSHSCKLLIDIFT